jgi:hypothetical protein
MVIHNDDIITAFVVVHDRVTGQKALDISEGYEFIVITFDDHQYGVVKREGLRVKLSLQDVLDTRLRDLPKYILQPYLVDSVQYDLISVEERDRIAALNEGEYLIVLRDNRVFGIYMSPERIRGFTPSTDIEPDEDFTGSEPEWGEEMEGADLGTPIDLPIDEETTTVGRDITLSGDGESGGEEGRQRPEERFINAEIEDHDKDRSLRIGDIYTLAFWLEAGISDTSIISGEETRLRTEELFAEGETEVDLTIYLQSNDFSIDTEKRIMRVPFSGVSKRKVRFEIEPLHEGKGTIQAVFLKNGNFIQVISIHLFTGDQFDKVEFSSTTLGRDVEGAFHLDQPRDINLVITEITGGFQLILTGPVAATATLPITREYLEQMIDDSRRELHDIVHLDVSGSKIYQDTVDIPVRVRDLTLRILASAGYSLFEKLFYSPGMDAQANLLGDKLRQMTRDHQLNIQIFSQHLTLPWGLIYVGEDLQDPNPSHFWGLKHIIEHIPLQQSMKVTDRVVDASGGLKVSLNVNTDIDQQMPQPYVQPQIQHWQDLTAGGNVQLTLRDTGQEVLAALKDETTQDQIAYYYCHAISKGLGKDGGPDESVLVFADNQRLTLKDLRLYQRKILPNTPLVFINACESAQLSPLFYDGFVPYFMTKGARGVIGTECETPALFAMEWANRFFDRYLNGDPLGKVVLELRQEFFAEHNNILGLLYAIYVDADTRLKLG